MTRALRRINAGAHLDHIYAVVKQECEAVGRTLSKTWPATVRRELQQDGRFVSEAKRSGRWRLAKPTPTVSEDTV